MLTFAKTSRSAARPQPVVHRRAAPPQPLGRPRPLGPAPCACGGSCPRCKAESGQATREGHANAAPERETSAQGRQASETEGGARHDGGTHDVGVEIPEGDEFSDQGLELLPEMQGKFTVSQPTDPAEREADLVADQVTGGGSDSPAAARISRRALSRSVKRTCDGCEDNATLQTAPAQGAAPAVSGEVANRIEALRGHGESLAGPTRSFFESRFGGDFSGVHMHTDQTAGELAAAVGARAFTLGTDVFFGAGQFALQTHEGKWLLAHELTHVVQQGGIDGVPSLSRDAILQRDACQCCPDSVSISNISRIDTPTRMGHNFDVNIALSYPEGDSANHCVLQWNERTNVPYMSTMVANQWNDMFTLAPTSPTFNPWRSRVENCASSSSVTITDVPSLGRRPGRTVTRTLEFNIVINSSAISSNQGCSNASTSVTATQVLVMNAGAPDWGASSFTTP